jgi:membrane protein YqaA with SNARE-associated domain
MNRSGDTLSAEATTLLSPWQRRVVQQQDLLTRAVPLVIVLGFITAGLVMWATGKFDVERVGYGGVWFFAFIGASSIFVPIPSLAAVCVAATPSIGLNPLVIGVVAGSAEALGELTGYLAGLGGRGFLERNRFYPRVRKLLIRRGGLILFFGSVILNPLFDVIGVAAGSIGYPVRKFLLYVFLAKAIKSTGFAYACFWGVPWIKDFVG